MIKTHKDWSTETPLCTRPQSALRIAGQHTQTATHTSTASAHKQQHTPLQPARTPTATLYSPHTHTHTHSHKQERKAHKQQNTRKRQHTPLQPHTPHWSRTTHNKAFVFNLSVSIHHCCLLSLRWYMQQGERTVCTVAYLSEAEGNASPSQLAPGHGNVDGEVRA